MLLFLLTALALAGDCDLSGLQSAITQGEQAFGEMEPERFQEAVSQADKAMGCMSQPLTPVEAAGYHRLKALASFFANDSSATILHFQSVQGTQPGYKLPEEIAPEGHPLRESYLQAAQFQNNATFSLPTPADGWLNIDGQRSEAAPSGRPFIFQRLSSGGRVEQTAYQSVGKALPSFAVKKVDVAQPVPQPVTKSNKGAKIGLLASGIGLVAVGAGLYGGAFATKGAYDDAVASGDKDKIDGAAGTTNALTIAGIGGGVLGAGLTITGIVIR